MDTEEARKIAHHASLGKPETDEGPYYHESWWEAYKGAVKGVIGGLAIGAGLGLAVGAVAVGALALIGGVTVTTALAGSVALGFSGLGAVLGAHEFSSIGTVTGAVAAAHEKAEERIKEFEESRFAELKSEIKGLRAAITGGADTPAITAAMAAAGAGTPSCEEIDARHNDYRTQHCDQEHCGEPRKWVFWKVAMIGAGVGAASGALLGYSGMFGEFLHPLEAHIAPGQITLASAVVGSSLGASFGINRDLFRNVFDVTDRMFKGILPHQANRAAAPAQAQCHSQETLATHVLPEPALEPQRASTHFQDRLSTEALRKAVLSIDHTTAIRQ